MRYFLFQLFVVVRSIPESMKSEFLTNEMGFSNILKCYLEVKKTFSENSSEKIFFYFKVQEIMIQRKKEREKERKKEFCM